MIFVGATICQRFARRGSIKGLMPEAWGSRTIRVPSVGQGFLLGVEPGVSGNGLKRSHLSACRKGSIEDLQHKA